jgi:zinc protease
MVQKYQLPNGMTVLLVQTNKSPVVSVQTFVNTGSADEGKGEEGISHFIEHLLFKGTDKYKVGEIAALVEGSGGELNAYTSFDQTVFYVTISKNFTDVALDTISEMMGRPSFDESEIDNEREVVIEEIKRSNDSPHRMASRQLFSTVYKKHPYALPVIGFEENIRTVGADVLKRYFFSRYVPQNMTLVVTGDFEANEIKPKIKKYFGSFKKYALKKVKRAVEPKQDVPRVLVENSTFKETHLNVAWPGPNVKHKDTPGLDVLSIILGSGESSRLYRSLRLNTHTVNSIGAGAFTPKDQGVIYVSAQLEGENTKAALDLIAEDLLKLWTEAPSPEEVDKAKVILESEDFYSLETVNGLARKYGNYQQLFGDVNYFPKYLKAIAEVTPSKIQELARKYLDPKVVSITLMSDKNKAELEKTANQWIDELQMTHELVLNLKVPSIKKTAPRAKLGFKTKAGKSEVQSVVLSNGTKLFLLPSHETPTVSVKFGFLGGLTIEPDGKNGIGELVAGTWTTGTKNKTEDQINHKMDSLASSVSAFSGRNTAGLNLTTLSPFLKDTLGLTFDILTDPTFPSETIDREKKAMLQSLHTRQDNPAQTAVRKFTELMFKGHHYEKDMMGTEGDIKKMNSQDAKNLWQSFATSKNLSVCAVGAFDSDQIIRQMEEGLAGISNKSVKVESKRLPGLAKSERFFEKSSKEQSHIILGYRGLNILDEDKYSLEIIDSILSGQGGRLFLELRDKASLAYSVSPIQFMGLEGGYFATYIGCSPEKGEKAISMMRQELAKLVEKKVDDGELDRAKRYIVGKHDIGLQRNSALASAILFNEIYGISYKDAFALPEKIKTVTAADIQRVAKRVLTSTEILVCVGAQQPW